MVTVVMSPVRPSAPSSGTLRSVSSDTVAVAIGLVGSVTSIIWTPLSRFEPTRAYVEESMVTVVMALAPSSSVKPP